uniref:Uncharacterized protein n=1 Tax=Helianthus annuus TaxID=4232 RepID=A0A251TFH1_HELAN
MIEDFVVMVCFCCFCYMILVFMVEFRMIEDFVVMFINCIYRFGDKFGKIGSRLCMKASFSWL